MRADSRTPKIPCCSEAGRQREEEAQSKHGIVPSIELNLKFWWLVNKRNKTGGVPVNVLTNKYRVNHDDISQEWAGCVSSLSAFDNNAASGDEF